MSRNTPALQRSKAAVAAAEASADQAQAALWPRLQVSAGAGFSPVRPRYNQSYALDGHQFMAMQSLIPSATVSAGWALSMQALREYRSSQAGAKAQRYTLDADRHNLLLSLASAALEVMAAQRLAERNESGQQAAEQRLTMTRRMVELGRATRLDENRFLQDLHEVQQDVVASNRALWDARDALGAALGVNAPVDVAAEFDFDTLLDDPQVSGCIALDSTADRASLKAARFRTQQAEDAVAAAKLAYLPELRFENNYQANYADTMAITFGGGRELLHNWVASASLVWTVFDAGRTAEVDRRSAELNQARADERELALQLEAERRSADRLVHYAKENLSIAENDMSAAREADELARRSFELGRVSALEGVDAAKRRRAAEIALALRESELLYARIRARMAMALCR